MKQHIKTHRGEKMTEEEKARYLPKPKHQQPPGGGDGNQGPPPPPPPVPPVA